MTRSTSERTAAQQAALDRIDVRAALDALKLEWRERAGEAWLCCVHPLHSERSPSLHVGLRGVHKGDWRCFGCAEGGGFASFVALAGKFHKDREALDDGTAPLDYARAWDWIAARAGVSLDAAEAVREGLVVEPHPLPPKIEHVRERVLQLPADAVPAGESEEALAYLLHRGVTVEQANRHRLGYVRALRRIVVPTIVHGRLEVYDLRAIDDECAACGRAQARALGRSCGACGGRMRAHARKTYGASREEGARPERAIWGHDWVRRGDDVVLCEGPWGAMACERAGLVGLALRGSHLQDEQLAILAALPARSIVVLPDGDTAGSKLAVGAVELAWRASARVLLGQLAPRAQPDDLAPAELRAAVAAAERPTVRGLVAAAAPAELPAKR